MKLGTLKDFQGYYSSSQSGWSNNVTVKLDAEKSKFYVEDISGNVIIENLCETSNLYKEGLLAVKIDDNTSGFIKRWTTLF